MNRDVLDRLLEDTLTKYQILFHNLTFHGHNAHHLVSLHLLGANDRQLEDAYENMTRHLDLYQPSPETITLENWRTFLGNKKFCKSYRDFFQDQLTSKGDQWMERFWELLLDHPSSPMINSLVSGVAHPLIHLGYALEVNSLPVAIETLTLTAVCYNYLHETVDRLEAPKSPSKSALTIFKDIRADSRLPIYDAPGVRNLESTVKNCLDLVLSHYHQWNIDSNHLEKTVEELFDLSVFLYAATHKPNQIEFDFFLLHLLTGMHAVRILQLHLKDNHILEHLLYQFFYFAIVIYISQLRPEIDETLIDQYPIEHNWDYVIERTLNSNIMYETHAVKAIRALRDGERAYGSKNGFYLKAALKTVDHINLDDPWIGGSSDERQLNVLKKLN